MGSFFPGRVSDTWHVAHIYSPLSLLTSVFTDFIAYVHAYLLQGDFDKMMAFLTTQGATSVGAVGFCFGAWALCKVR